MVVIRLSRVGKKSHATWRVIVSDKRKDTLGTYLELLGSYDPHQSPPAVKLNAERVKYWLSVGAKPSPTVNNLLIDQGVLPGPKPARKMVPKPVDTNASVPVAPVPAAEKPVAEAKPAEAPVAPEPEAIVTAEEKPVAEAVIGGAAKKSE